MKYTLLTLLVLGFGHGALAVEAKKSTTPGAKVEKEDLDLLAKSHNMKVDINCQLKDGKEIKQGEAGFEDCLKEVKKHHTKSSKEEAGADIKVEKGHAE